jgi:hypothetical protein
MWIECKPCNLEFFEVAPFKIVTEIILLASPLKVFQTFADPMSWPQWFKEIKSVTWTSQQIDKVNATREVVLKILGIPITLRERFIAWTKVSASPSLSTP